jgi:hypothetical protein
MSTPHVTTVLTGRSHRQPTGSAPENRDSTAIVSRARNVALAVARSRVAQIAKAVVRA